MLKINIKIDGIDLSVAPELTVLQAAASAGIDIPTFCYDPELSAPGACRICVVEIPGRRGLAPACVTVVEEGMVIKTESPSVVESRIANLELLLANHPFDCMTCEKTGKCKLQDYTYRYNVKETPYHGEKYNYLVDESNPFISRDMNKCILCGNCVRVCSEVVGRGIYDFINRGYDTKVAPALDAELLNSECVFCGSCVEVCPTGAITSKMMHGMGRPWEMTKVKTTCGYCGVGCNYDFNVKDGKVVGVSSNPDSVVNGRWLCVKGRYGYSFIHHPDRLTKPLIRKDGVLQEAQWDEALGLIADKFKDIKNKFGADALAVLSSARMTNEENYLVNKFTRAVIGTNNIDHCARLCHASTVKGLMMAYGGGAMTNSIAEIGDTDFILALGTNTTETHPVLALQIFKARQKGAGMAVVDPRNIEIATQADFHLQALPGTDVAIINALAYTILTEGLHDKEFIDQRTEGFADYAGTLQEYRPEKVEKLTGISAELLIQTARAYAKAPKAMILYTMGITQHTTGTDNVIAIANLAMLTGHVGSESNGVCPLRGQNNVQGACDMGALPDVFPGYQRVDNEDARLKFETAWNVKLSKTPGLTLGEIFDHAFDGKIKAMYIIGENPLVSDPDVTHVEKALENLDFLVVQDIFLSETAQKADVVLPAASFAEKTGTFTNTERRVQMVRKAVKSPGESKADSQIIAELAKRMGYLLSSEPSEIFSEAATLTPQYAGMSYARLEVSGLQWPCPTLEHAGTKVLHQDKFIRGKGKFHVVHFLPPNELPDEEYPFVLTTGRRLYHYHTGTMTRRSKALSQIMPEEFLEINPKDAARIGISQHDKVKVASRRGEILIPVQITQRVIPGLVFASFHFCETLINAVTNSARDGQSKIPELKTCAVKVQKI